MASLLVMSFALQKKVEFTLITRGRIMADVKYGKSLKKLEEIIEKIESEEIDVDELSESVKEAVSLIKTCKSKIEKAEFEVKKVVDGFDA